jgi:hypothetical protein
MLSTKLLKPKGEPLSQAEQYQSPIIGMINELWEKYHNLEKMFQPLEPLFDLDVAAQIVPMELDSLKYQLNLGEAKLDFPKIYRLDKDRRRRRVLRARDIRNLRERTLRGPDKHLVC